MGVYLFLLANIYPRTDLLIELNLLCWGILCIVTNTRDLVMYMSILAGVAVFASLAKFSLLFMAAMTIGVVSGDLVLRKRCRYSGGLAALAVLGFVAGWMGARQDVSNLPAFIARGLATSQGYNAAMGYEGSVELRRRAILAALLATATIVAGAGRGGEGPMAVSRTRQALRMCWMFGMLFLVWKHGFVRTDVYHAGFFFGFVPILALTLETSVSATAVSAAHCAERHKEIPRGWLVCSQRLLQFSASLVWTRLFATSCCLVSLFTVQSMILPGDWEHSLLQPFAAIGANLSHLASPAKYGQRFLQEVSAERQRSRLPGLSKVIGQSTVDMFGCEQISILANDLNYRPRPVFQSYAAYSAPLMQWNEIFYRSVAAPQYVLFRLMAMDRKFPPLEDALLLRHLLINYAPVASEGPFLLLKSKRAESADLKLLRAGTIQTGQPLSLVEYNEGNLWLELDLTETFLGRLRHILYQPAKSRLVISSGPAGKEMVRRFRAPASMLAAGFLISPVEFNTEDVLRLYQGAKPTRPSACSVEFNPGDETFWARTIRFRLYRIQNILGRRTAEEPQ
jgi:hypothetical protein